MSCNCLNGDCFPTIRRPWCVGTAGPAGANGVNGGVVLYNDMDDTSLIPGTGSWMDFVTPKEYTLPITQLSGNGDRLKIDIALEIHTSSDLPPAVRVMFDSVVVGYISTSASTAVDRVLKFTIILDRAAATGSANNMLLNSVCEYFTGLGIYPVPSPSARVMMVSPITMNYATAPAKVIKVQGYRNTPTMAGDYIKCKQLCVEYFKKI